MRAASEVARRLGLRFADPFVLRDRSNTLVHLRPAPVVARVATATGTVRPGTAWLSREVAVARHLAAAGAPAVPPSDAIDPGPHEHDGLAMSFFSFVAPRAEVPDPAAAGRALRACHDALADYPGPLPTWGVLDEAARLVEHLAATSHLTPADADLLRAANARATHRLAGASLALRPLHGDAHLNNVLASAQGPLWNDFEDSFCGPLAWDLACLVASSRIYGRDPAPAARALEGYGGSVDEEALGELVEARALQVAVWGALLGRLHPARGEDPEREMPLRFLRARARGRGPT